MRDKDIKFIHIISIVTVVYSNVHWVDFVADLGMTFVDDWAFLAGRVVGNEKD